VLHIVHLIRRRYPDRSEAIIARLFIASGAALALGAGLLLLARQR
jgi:hypothetical protein